MNARLRSSGRRRRGGRRRIVLAGASGYGNVGDDAIALAVGRLLREADPEAKVIALGGDPAALSKAARMPACHLSWRSPASVVGLVKLVARSDAVLIGGGGLLQDMLPHFYRPYLLLAAVAKALGKPVMLYAVGAYPPRTRVFRATHRAVLDRVDVVTARDEFSAESMAAAGVHRPITVTADPVVTLVPPERPWVRDENDGTPVGVSLRPWYHLGHMSGSGDQTRLVNALAETLDAVVQATARRLLFLPMHYGGADDDRRFQERVASRMTRRAAVSIFASGDPLEVLSAIRACDLMLGMRLHANVLAAAAGVPSVALAYDQKVGGFMRRLGCGDQAVTLDEMQPRAIADRAAALLADREQAVARVEEGRERLAASARECAAVAVRLAGARDVAAEQPASAAGGESLPWAA